MGAVPLFALSVVGFPVRNLPETVLQAMLAGGARTMVDAKVSIIGGHSVQDPELKLGYAVTGTVHPSKVYTNRNARAGDVLILTKPIGTGTITTGIKRGVTPSAVADAAIAWMLRLNDQASRSLGEYNVNAVTDITGYGLLGHAYEVAKASGVTIAINAQSVPLMEGALDLGQQDVFPGAVQANRRYIGDQIQWFDTAPVIQKLLLDPQTSGGLLISLPEAEVPALIRALGAKGITGHVIGRVLPHGAHLLEVS